MSALLILCSLLLPAVIGTRPEVRHCVFSDLLQQHGTGSQRSAGRDNTTVRCGPGLVCFGLWEQRPGGEVLLLKQGCWTSQPDCLSDLCLVTVAPAHIHQGSYRFCCCSHDLCNSHFREAPPTLASPVQRQSEGGGYGPALIAVGTVGVAVIAVLLLICGLKGQKKLSSSTVDLLETLTPCAEVDGLRLGELIGRGRFASVYRGSLSDRTVAVKVFSSAHRNKYANQRAINCLPLLRQHHNLAHFLYTHERDDEEGHVQHLLVMDYYPHGCLSHFLTHSCLDWMSCCRMMLGVTRGLSFLHSESHDGDQSKPAMAHRDVSSSNVLVRSDLSCVLSGFSLSMSLIGGQGKLGGVSISEAGALRYRAPELLTGALDLREYGTALKRVDAYALGLLFWESFRRCQDLFPNKAPHFELAFETELGAAPSLEDMHELVCRGKRRPPFPSEWDHSRPGLRLLKETMEDCWDQEAEARLSAQCAEERLSQLSLLTPSSQDQVTRTSCAQHQVMLQRPLSLQLLSTTTSRGGLGPPQLPARLEGPLESSLFTASEAKELRGHQSRKWQVETGVARMNVVAAPAPVTIAMATNRGAVLMADGSSAGASTLVTNSLMVQALTNHDLCRGGSEDEVMGRNFLWSPDEQQPLLRNELPPAGALPALHSNVNNNNNYRSDSGPWTERDDKTGSPIPPQAQLSLLTSTETGPTHLTCYSAPSVQPEEHNMTDISDRRDTAVVSVESPKNNRSMTKSQTSEVTCSFTDLLPAPPIPMCAGSSEHPSGIRWSPQAPDHTTSAQLSQMTSDLSKTMQPPRPCSLDLSSPSAASSNTSGTSGTNGAPLIDLALGASGEKIRRRVKTPYTVKKWRPSSWAPPTDPRPDPLFLALPKISQSQSSAAVFLLRGGASAHPGPDGLTSF